MGGWPTGGVTSNLLVRFIPSFLFYEVGAVGRLRGSVQGVSISLACVVAVSFEPSSMACTAPHQMRRHTSGCPPTCYSHWLSGCLSDLVFTLWSGAFSPAKRRGGRGGNKMAALCCVLWVGNFGVAGSRLRLMDGEVSVQWSVALLPSSQVCTGVCEAVHLGGTVSSKTRNGATKWFGFRDGRHRGERRVLGQREGLRSALTQKVVVSSLLVPFHPGLVGWL